MTSDIKAHLSDYALLMIWLTLGFLGLAYYRSNPDHQLWLLLVLLLGYVVWGGVHHARLGDVSVKIMLEYLLVASLALILVWAVLAVA